MQADMSDAADIGGRDRQTGRFLAGNNGGGRKLGARNRLGEQFIADLENTWKKHGPAAMERCAIEEPAQFGRIMASLLPKQIEVDAAISVFSELQSADEVLAMIADELGDEAARVLADALDRHEMLTIDAEPVTR